MKQAGKENRFLPLVWLFSPNQFFFFPASLALSCFFRLWFSPFILVPYFSFLLINFLPLIPAPHLPKSQPEAQQLDHFTAWKGGCSAPSSGNPMCEYSVLALSQLLRGGSSPFSAHEGFVLMQQKCSGDFFRSQ